jgi:serine/threonine protein phosphatase PrpC/serine/threonine protein kinase
MLARLKGMMHASKPTESSPAPAPACPPKEPEREAAIPICHSVEADSNVCSTGNGPEVAPVAEAVAVPPPDATPNGSEAAPAAPALPAVPVAAPVAETAAGEDVPVAEVVPAEAKAAERKESPTAEPPIEDIPTPLAEAPPAMEYETPAAPARETPAAPVAFPCPVCGSPRRGESPSCDDCGYYFSKADLVRAAAPSDPPPPAVRLQDRYELGERIGERGGVRRYRGLDHGDGSRPPVPVVILEQEAPVGAAEAVPEPALALEASEADDADEVLPGFDALPPVAAPATEILPARPNWPSIAWERALLTTLELPSLPGVLAWFTEGNLEYLVEEAPAGRPLWEAWDDPESTSEIRYGWLVEVAETLHRLHQCNAIVEGLRPDLIVISPEGQARLADLGDLLPLPVPADAPLRGTLYTAPELLAGGGKADARADLYSFGGMLYALHVGRDLSEVDFDKPGNPKPFIPRFPDIHPAFGRLITKTFRREPLSRFPTDEAGKVDPTGFVELIGTLSTLRRTLDNVRLEIAGWTNTGIVRTGNEDAYALLHACETRQEDVSEAALVLLCDGMGGYEAGEVAAALCIQIMRKNLTQQPMFAHLAGASAFPADALNPPPPSSGHAGPPLNVEQAKAALKAALRDANRQVYAASRAPGSKRRGMGCTAEAVYVDARNVVVGHVGDSRTYHLHEGRMIQLTRDQTLVNRLVELGTLTPEEAETHPRRNELQQAIGGQPDVEPGLYHGVLKPGDWVLVCSDGVTNHVSANDLKQMLQSEASSAEMAARRLVNLVNIEGATDNATIVVIRAT